MLSSVRKRLTYANVMATIAVFIALGLGSAWAATELGRNSVGSRQIEKNAVKAAEIATNAVRSGEVKNDALTSADVNEGTFGQVPSAQSADTAGFAGSANPEVFARVLKNGTVDESNSKGVTQADVTLSGDTYCFSGLPFQPRGLQASEDYQQDAATASLEVSLGTTVECPAGTQAFVWARDASTGFFVVFYR